MNDYYGAVYSLEAQTEQWKWLFGGGLTQYKNNHFGKIINASQGVLAEELGNRFYDSDATKTEWNNYLKVNYEEQKNGRTFNYFADLQLRLINYQAAGVHDNLSPIDFNENFLFFNPKIGLSTQRRTAKVAHQWDVFLGVGQREPTRADFLNSATTPEAEQMLNFELGKSWSSKNWSFMANHYMMIYSSQLVLTGQLDAVGTPLRENVGQSYRTGIELVGDYKLSTKANIGGNLTLSDNRVIDYKEQLDGDTNILFRGNTPIAYSPNLTSSIYFTYRFNSKFNILLQNKTVGKQYLDNTGVEDKTIPAFNTTDLIVNYRMNLRRLTRRSTPINLSFYAYNITNTKFVNNGWSYSYRDQGEYISLVGVYPQAPIHFMVKLSYLF